ncbi:unnamed protein product [Penicillium bialowiezense]
MSFDATNKKNSFADAMIEYHQNADKEAKKDLDEKLAIWKKTELKSDKRNYYRALAAMGHPAHRGADKKIWKEIRESI